MEGIKIKVVSGDGTISEMEIPDFTLPENERIIIMPSQIHQLELPLGLVQDLVEYDLVTYPALEYMVGVDLARDWRDKSKEDMTVEDALQAELEGFNMVCEDGKVIIVAHNLLV